MAKLLLAISGRVEEGEALSASVFNTATGTSALTGFTLQWQVFNGSTWTNIGAANSLTYTIPAGNSAIGKSYRLISTPSGANEASTSAATAPAVADSKTVHAPTLADVATSLALAENAAATLLDSAVTFSDADNGNFGGGSLTILNSNSLAAGGDGLDLLSVRNQGTGAGQIGYNAATREVFYSAQAGNTVLIGVVDSTLGGNGADLQIAFNANATKVAIDKLIESIQFSNNDDSPTGARLLTIKVADPGAGSVQRVIQVNITPSADGPSFTGPSTFFANENQLMVGTIAAIDPDREAAAAQGISYSLVAGTGSADNALFTVDAATGQLSFLAAPDFEGAHAPAYSVRVRASDSNGGVAERVVQVQVQSVNEAPIAQALAATIQEDAASTSLTANFGDPDAGDSHTITLNTAGTIGTVTRQGSNFLYDAGNQFQSLGQGQTATDTFSYTVTDAGGLSSTRTATITIVGSNDAAVVGGTTTSDVTEDTNVVNGLLMASGTLSIADVDAGQGHFVAQASATGDLFGGTFSIDQNGAWTWQLESNSPVGQVVPGGASYADSFTVTTADGTTQVVSVNVHGVNDAASFTGVTSLTLTEDAGVVNGELKGSASAGIVDPDFNEARVPFQFQVPGTGGYGSFTVGENGTWLYRVNNSLQAVQALGVGETLVDTLTVTTVDGSATVALTAIVQGANDAPVIVPDPNGYHGTVREYGDDANGPVAGSLVATGTLFATDADGDALGWSSIVYSQYGTLTVDSLTGAWAYTLDDSSVDSLGAGDTVTDTLMVAVGDNHGGSASQSITITIEGANDAPRALAGSTSGSVTESSPDGKLVLPYGVASGTFEVAVDAQGRLLMVGAGSDPSQHGLWRLNEDGSADTTFGSGGSVYMEAGTAFEHVVVDSAGRYVAAGQSVNAVNSSTDVAVVRYLDDGSLDTSFGVNGTVVIDLGGDTEYPTELFTGAAGKVVVVANVQTGSQNTSHLALTRLNADGSLDVGFGNGGNVVLEQPEGSLNGMQVVPDAQGRLIVWGNVYRPGTELPPGPFVHMTRLLADGSVDTSFGDDGSFEFSLDGWYANRGNAIVADEDGGFVLGWGAYTYEAGHHVNLTRFGDDGATDSNFGTSGTVATALVTRYGSSFDMAMDSDGRLVVAPREPGSSWSPYDFTVARFNSDGSADSAFGNAGLAVADMGGDDQGRQLVLGANGDILLAGSRNDFSVLTALARFKDDGSLDATFGGPPDDEVWGFLNANDPDGPSSLTWHTDAASIYGNFLLQSTGDWSFRLDNSRAATQALAEGQSVTETFVVTASDALGASSAQEVTITIVGSYDAPTP